ncbi:MAG: CcmD family protein [Chthonomonadales bacterium]|nr:CcmD family protein [Chthonomonadales bacterium]
MPTNMISLAIVPLVVWIGVVAYLFVIDRRLARLEADKETDGL